MDRRVEEWAWGMGMGVWVGGAREREKTYVDSGLNA